MSWQKQDPRISPALSFSGFCPAMSARSTNVPFESVGRRETQFGEQSGGLSEDCQGFATFVDIPMIADLSSLVFPAPQGGGEGCTLSPDELSRAMMEAVDGMVVPDRADVDFKDEPAYARHSPLPPAKRLRHPHCFSAAPPAHIVRLAGDPFKSTTPKTAVKTMARVCLAVPGLDLIGTSNVSPIKMPAPRKQERSRSHELVPSVGLSLHSFDSIACARQPCLKSPPSVMSMILDEHQNAIDVATAAATATARIASKAPSGNDGIAYEPYVSAITPPRTQPNSPVHSPSAVAQHVQSVSGIRIGHNHVPKASSPDVSRKARRIEPSIFVGGQHWRPASSSLLPSWPISTIPTAFATAAAAVGIPRPMPMLPPLRCRCQRSKCLKLYCDCFQSGKVCSPQCTCKDCSNTVDASGRNGDRTAAIKAVLQRRPDAFKPKTVADSCQCSKSNCLKRYCACWKTGRKCDPTKCTCTKCDNIAPSYAGIAANLLKLNQGRHQRQLA